MAIIREKNIADYTVKIGGLAKDTLSVVSFCGSETISQLFNFSFDLASADPKIDFASVIGQPALFTLQMPVGKRYVRGIVNEFEQTGKAESGPWTFYRAEVVPSVWLLSNRTHCRIFQDKALKEIIEQVLKNAGIPSDQVRFSLQGTYKCDYCVQYRESDLNFIHRLMEQYGLFYFFEHSKDNHVMVIGDNPAVHVPVASPDTALFHDPGGTGVADQEHISAFRYHQEIRSGATRLRDFDFKKPSLNLEQESAANANGEGNLEVYDYPGEYVAPDEGNGLVKVRLEALRTTRQIGFGQSDCRRFLPGFRFTLEGHNRGDFNREYLIIRLSQSGSQPQVLGAEAGGAEGKAYENSFECIPSDTPFRPSRITPKPIIQGPQTAMVVGPSGDEIYTDEYGRVKVQFHWDREGKQDEKSSCWVRVSLPWAGANWGAIFIPRIGQEVIVEFLEGDPDRPLITGRVYNGANMPPYDLPGAKTKSTIKSNSSPGGGGSNELRFEDAKGSEEVYLHGQKDWTILIENDKNQKVGHDEVLLIENDQSQTVINNKTLDVGVNHTEKIGANMTISIGSSKTEIVSLASTETVGAAKALTIGGAYQISVGAAMNETVAGLKAEQVGAFKSEAVGGGKSESIGGGKNFSTGKDLTETIGGKRAIKIAKDRSEDVMGKSDTTVKNNLSIQSQKKIMIQAADELLLKSGDASILLKKNGDVVIQGKKITVKASGDLQLKGQKITEN